MMTPSIYDYRDAEIAAAREARRERRRAVLEAVVGGPLLAAAMAGIMWLCACA